MKLRYVGGLAKVEVPLGNFTWRRCDRGGTVEVPDDIGHRLLEQDVWERADTPAAPAAPPQAAAGVLERLTNAELRARAEAAGVAVPARATKAQLVQALTSPNDKPIGG